MHGDPPPPNQPLIEFDDAGEVICDQNGIAAGGIRPPQAAAPVAGSNMPFDTAALQSFYGDEKGYLSKVRQAAAAAAKAGVMLPRDVEPAVFETASEYRRARQIASPAPAAATG